MSSGIFLLVLTSAIFHAGWNFAARKVSGNFIVLWCGLWTGCLLFLPLVIGITVLKGWSTIFEMISGGWGYIVATGVIHGGYFIFLSRAYAHGEISVVYPIARGSGVGLTAALAWVLLQEDLSVTGICGIILISIAISLNGLLVYTRHPDTNNKGITQALLVGLTIVAYSLIDKIGVGIVEPILYIWLMFLISALLLWPYVVRFHPAGILKIISNHTASIVLIGGGMIGTYTMILFAYTLGPVSYIIAVREVSVVIGVALGVVFLNEKMSIPKIAIILMIVLGMLCIRMA